MTFTVAEECSALGLRAGAIVFRDVTVSSAGAELRAEIAREVENVRARFADVAAVRSAPAVASFQELLRKVGVNPRRTPPSLERLLRSMFERGDLPAINSLVDAYNLLSVRTACSLGAHDLERIALPVALRLLRGSERFTPLGRTEAEAVVAGEYGYVDADNRLLCRLDVLQADFSKVTAQTRQALLIVEATADHAPGALRAACAAAAELIPRYCGGTAEVVALPE